MGYMRLDAMMVTTWREKEAEALHAACRDAYVAAGGSPDTVSELSPPLVNGYRSFAVWPDGSKEGWENSNAGDAGREAVKAVLRASKCYPKWVEFVVGEEDDVGEPRIKDSHMKELDDAD